MFEEIYSFKTTNSYSRDNLNYKNGTLKNIHYGDIHTKFNSPFNITKELVPFINEDVDISKIEEESYLLEGDLVIADASEDYNDIGKTIEISNLNDEKVVAGLHTFLARKESDEMVKGFASFLMKTWNVRLAIMKIAQGTKVLGISTKRLAHITFFIPQPEEQQKIASFLTAVDERIQLLHEKKAKLEEYKKGVIQKLFSKEISFKDQNGNSFPNWELRKMSDFLRERNDKAPKSDQYPLMAFIANKGVAPKGDRYNRDFLVTDSDNKKYKKTEFGDFIYSSNNLETGSIGLNRYGSASISPVYSIFKIKENANHIFLDSFLTRKSFIHKMTRYRQGVVYGQWRIHESDFLKIEDYIPCSEEQICIANFIESMDKKISLCTNELMYNQSFLKALIQKMFVS